MAQTVKNPPTMQGALLQSWVRKTPWRKAWKPTPAFLPGESRGKRSLAGYSPRGHKESDTAERLTFSLPTSSLSITLGHFLTEFHLPRNSLELGLVQTGEETAVGIKEDLVERRFQNLCMKPQLGVGNCEFLQHHTLAHRKSPHLHVVDNGTDLEHTESSTPSKGGTLGAGSLWRNSGVWLVGPKWNWGGVGSTQN